MRLTTVMAFVLSALFIFVNPIFAQQYEIIYPNGKTAISEKALPPSVYLAQKNTLQITAEFFSKSNPELSPYIFSGSGFIDADSGNVVSARHLLVEAVMDLFFNYGEKFYIDDKGIPRGVNYDYRFYASVVTAGPDSLKHKYPLSVAAIGPINTYLDVIIFKPTQKIPVRGLKLSNDIGVGEIVYASGLTKAQSHFHKPDSSVVYVDINTIKFTAENTILAFLEKIESGGVKRIYQLFRPIQHGFSGGPLLNKKGEVVGILIETHELFSFAVSSEDVKMLIKKIR